ncbi:MAG: hypothetical protein ABH879_07630 [archaeon]
MAKIRDAYKELGIKFDLVPFEGLNSEFEIECIDDKAFLLREIRRKISDKADYYAKMLEQILQPDAAYSSAHECRGLETNDKQTIFQLYSTLMRIHRSAIEVEVIAEDRADAEFINDSYKTWMALKKPLAVILKAIRESWQQHQQDEEKVGYFG